METEIDPWIEVKSNQEIMGISSSVNSVPAVETNYHALFACTVSVRSSDVRQGFLWGFNWGSLLQDAIERQRLFILSQHFPGDPKPKEIHDNRTLALRCICRPSTPDLQISLIGKTCGSTAKVARNLAVEYWREIYSTFPYDYQIIPADSEVFQQVIGDEILHDAIDANMFAEVQRFQTTISSGKEWFYYLGRWKHSDFSAEQIWRVLAGANKRIVYNVILRPTVLFESEIAALELLADHVQKIADDVDDFRVKPYAEYAASHYQDLLQRLRRPYIIQTRLVAPDGLPDYIPRMIGFANTYDPERESILPNFQVTHPENTIEEITLWRNQLLWLEPDIRMEKAVDNRFNRVSKLCDFYEAQTLFRFPYPPKGGFPGLNF